jgi:SUMO ligase MMS21 Smc5/6 complex component
MFLSTYSANVWQDIKEDKEMMNSYSVVLGCVEFSSEKPINACYSSITVSSSLLKIHSSRHGKPRKVTESLLSIL